MANVVTKTFAAGWRVFTGQHFNTAFGQINDAFNGSQVTALSAVFLRRSVSTGLTATGTTRADALALTSAINVIGTAAASTGTVLPAAATVGVGGTVVIFNDGASPIKVYAAGSDTIDGTAGSTGVTLTNALRCEFYVTAALTFKSAKLGATST